MTTVISIVACAIAIALADLRWLRVAQREHYLSGTVSKFVVRWWYSSAGNIALWTVAFVGIVLSIVIPEGAFLVAIAIAVGPLGLSIKGRTSKLAWTRRMRVLASVVVALEAIAIAIGAVLGEAAFVGALVAALVPTIVDLALAIAQPWENRHVSRFVNEAKTRLRSVSPTIIGITGSYGKTSTKVYLAHLLSGTKTVLATPASFNNRSGISRTINEQLAPGTEVFIAEMGTYGLGEITELCGIAPPSIAVLTAIGPVHIERFGSEAAIVQAKSEIFATATTCVLNVDDERIAALAEPLKAEGKTVVSCSATDGSADVFVRIDDHHMTVKHRGLEIAGLAAPNAAATNVACAVAVALEVGVPAADIGGRLGTLPVAAHRQEITRTEQGFTVIDDTYNANPASVRRGLELLVDVTDTTHRRVVATPGMVEMGRRQNYENAQFAAAIANHATDLVVIGRTNRKALLSGAEGTSLNVVTVDRLPEAVAWVREHAHEGDGVLYANDLPDHFC